MVWVFSICEIYGECKDCRSFSVLKTLTGSRAEKRSTCHKTRFRLLSPAETIICTLYLRSIKAFQDSLSFRKLQIFISQTTDSHFANYRFSFRFVSFRFAPFRFANYSKPTVFTFIDVSSHKSGYNAGCSILTIKYNKTARCDSVRKGTPANE